MKTYVYDCVMIFNPDVENANIEFVINDFKNCSHLHKKEPKIDHIKLKKLAYEMKGYDTGYYVQIYFLGTEEDALEIQRLLRINDDVLKFIVVKTDEDEDFLEDYGETEETKEEIIDLLNIIYGF